MNVNDISKFSKERLQELENEKNEELKLIREAIKAKDVETVDLTDSDVLPDNNSICCKSGNGNYLIKHNDSLQLIKGLYSWTEIQEYLAGIWEIEKVEDPKNLKAGTPVYFKGIGVRLFIGVNSEMEYVYAYFTNINIDKQLNIPDVHTYATTDQLYTFKRKIS